MLKSPLRRMGRCVIVRAAAVPLRGSVGTVGFERVWRRLLLDICHWGASEFLYAGPQQGNIPKQTVEKM